MINLLKFLYDSYKLKTIIIVTHGGRVEVNLLRLRFYHLILISRHAEFMVLLATALLSF
jgi:hypothetical protein